MWVKLYPANGDPEDIFEWDLAVEKFPWLPEFKKTLEGGIAVFSAEGIFERVEEKKV